MNLTLEVPKAFNDEMSNNVRKVYLEAIEKARADTIMLKTYLSINEITTQYLDITRPTIMAWVKKGLPTYEVEGKKYIKRIDLDNFIEKHKK